MRAMLNSELIEKLSKLPPDLPVMYREECWLVPVNEPMIERVADNGYFAEPAEMHPSQNREGLHILRR